MTQPALSVEEKEHKRQRLALQKKCNAITVKWSVGQLHSWAGVYEFTSVPPGATAEHLSSKPTFQELKAYTNLLYESLEKQFASNGGGSNKESKEGPTQAQASTEPSRMAVGRDEESSKDIVKETTPGSGFVNEPTAKELNEDTVQPQESTRVDKPVSRTVAGSESNYGLVSSPNEKVFLFWFQKKACAELLNGILGILEHSLKDTKELKEYYEATIKDIPAGMKVTKKRCQLLLAGTGTGKTFIAGALLRRLVDINFADGKTWGHVPYLYVTRATVVEQTERVFKNFFGLSIKDGVEVINIEQLRSKAGQLWIKEEITVENGKEKVNYKWKPYQQPCIILWDECQALKNEGTSQSEISYSYAECMPDQTYCVYISATPFTKVAEAKSFVLNINLTDNTL